MLGCLLIFHTAALAGYGFSFQPREDVTTELTL